jgi:hypothetical protein
VQEAPAAAVTFSNPSGPAPHTAVTSVASARSRRRNRSAFSIDTVISPFASRHRRPDTVYPMLTDTALPALRHAVVDRFTPTRVLFPDRAVHA